MNPTGYIPIPRELLADGHWAEEREYTKPEAIVYLFSKAAYKAGRPIVGGKPVAVQPGQLPASVRYLMQAWKWSNTKVENFLAELQENDTIIVEKTTGQNLITITFLKSYYAELTEKKTQKRQENDAETTEKRQQNDEIEEGNKEIKKKGEVRATPAPLFEVGSSTGLVPTLRDGSAQSATMPGSSEFDLLKRIGKPAAQIWTQSNADGLFQTPAHAELALEWLAARCGMGKPLSSHIELTPLVALFNKHNLADLRLMVEYSAGKYPNLYPDQIEKQKKKNSTSHDHSNTANGHIISEQTFRDVLIELADEGS
jgi:hypothetical protein